MVVISGKSTPLANPPGVMIKSRTGPGPVNIKLYIADHYSYALTRPEPAILLFLLSGVKDCPLLGS